MSLTLRLTAQAALERSEIGPAETYADVATGMLNKLRKFADGLAFFYFLKALSRCERRRYPRVIAETVITESDIARTVELARATLASLDAENREIASTELAALAAARRAAGAAAVAEVIESIFRPAAGSEVPAYPGAIDGDAIYLERAGVHAEFLGVGFAEWKGS